MIASNSMKMTTVVDDARLVQEIRKHDTLYDSRKRGNKDLPDKGQAWAAVSEVLGIPPVDAKNRWRNLRDRFVREKKRLLHDGEKVYGLNPWPLLEDMSFLWAFITHRNPLLGEQPKKKAKKSPAEFVVSRVLQPILPRPSPEWVNVTLDYDNPEGSQSPSVGVLNVDPQCVIKEEQHKDVRPETFDEHGSQLRRLLVDGHITETEGGPHSMLDLEDSKPTIREMSKDEDELFCLSVAASFKRFTPKMKAQAKWKIQQVLYDVEFNQSGASTSDS